MTAMLPSTLLPSLSDGVEVGRKLGGVEIGFVAPSGPGGVEVGMIRRIGPVFTISTAHPAGCAECGGMLFEDEKAAYVDGNITCLPCVVSIRSQNPIIQKALSKHAQDES